MIYSNYPFTLDIHGVVSQISFPVSLNDTARSLLISLTDGGKPYEITDGCRAVFAALKPDGTCLFNDCIIVGNKVIRYDFTPQTASVKGKVDCEVRLYGVDGNLVTSPRFTIVVYEGLLDERILSEDEKTTVDNMILAEQARIAAENERIASDAEREEIARRAEAAAKRVEESVNGDDVFIRYSAYPDGRDYTDTWQRGLNYIGVAAGLKEPEDASGYQWSLFAPNIYVGSGEMPDYADIQIDPDVFDTISEGATALGMNTVAGSRGFRILESVDNGDGTGTYTLEGYTEGYAEGDFYTLRINNCYGETTGEGAGRIYGGHIKAIEGNKITVDNYIADALVDEPVGDQNTFRVPSKPAVGNVDTGVAAVAFGEGTMATGANSVAEGVGTHAYSKYSHAEGMLTIAGYGAHAEGEETKAIGMKSHAEGHLSEAVGFDAHAEGARTKANGNRSHAEGLESEANGSASHAEGWQSHADGIYSHAEGERTTASGADAHAEGSATTASGGYSHAEGRLTAASGWVTHAEGYKTIAEGMYSHSEGEESRAKGQAAHAEGRSTYAGGTTSHTEGRNTKAHSKFSHAEGYGAIVGEEGDESKGACGHAEGSETKAAGEAAHAEGGSTYAGGAYSHAEGQGTQALKKCSHAGGYKTIANATNQTVIGTYNAVDYINEYAFIVGNGDSESNRSNAFAVKWDGTLVVGGVAITPAQLTKLLALIA